MSSAAGRFNLEPRKALVADADLHVGRLGYDRRVSMPLLDECVGADARKLLVDDCGDDQTATAQSVLANDPRGIDHGRDTALHVLRSTSVEPAVPDGGIERRGHSFDTDRVGVTAEHQRRSGAAAVQNADDVRPAWCYVLQMDVQPEMLQMLGDHAGYPGLGRCTFDKRRVDRIDGDQASKKVDAGVMHCETGIMPEWIWAAAPRSSRAHHRASVWPAPSILPAPASTWCSGPGVRTCSRRRWRAFAPQADEPRRSRWTSRGKRTLRGW